MKKYLLFFIYSIVITMNYSYSESSSEFIIAEPKKQATKKLGISALKETIGDNAELLFDTSLLLAKRLSLLQNNLISGCYIHGNVSGLTIIDHSFNGCRQKHLLHCIALSHEVLCRLQITLKTVIKKLAYDSKPFKKASRAMLTELDKTLLITHKRMQVVATILWKMNNCLGNKLCYKKEVLIKFHDYFYKEYYSLYYIMHDICNNSLVTLI